MKRVSFWLSAKDGEETTYDFIFETQAVEGPEAILYVVWEPEQLAQVAELMTTMRDDYHERRKDHEEERQVLHRNGTTEGGIIVVRH